MGISDLEKLKKLSWYTTVPLLVFAWVIQDKAYLDPTFFTFFGGVKRHRYVFHKDSCGFVCCFCSLDRVGI